MVFESSGNNIQSGDEQTIFNNYDTCYTTNNNELIDKYSTSNNNSNTDTTTQTNDGYYTYSPQTYTISNELVREIDRETKQTKIDEIVNQLYSFHNNEYITDITNDNPKKTTIKNIFNDDITSRIIEDYDISTNYKHGDNKYIYVSNLKNYNNNDSQNDINAPSNNIYQLQNYIIDTSNVGISGNNYAPGTKMGNICWTKYSQGIYNDYTTYYKYQIVRYSSDFYILKDISLSTQFKIKGIHPAYDNNPLNPSASWDGKWEVDEINDIFGKNIQRKFKLISTIIMDI